VGLGQLPKTFGGSSVLDLSTCYHIDVPRRMSEILRREPNATVKAISGRSSAGIDGRRSVPHARVRGAAGVRPLFGRPHDCLQLFSY
jgi:hypothetical protein